MPGFLEADKFFKQIQLEELCAQRGIPMPTPGAGRNPFGILRSKCYTCQRKDWNWRGIRRAFPGTDHLDQLAYEITHATTQVFYCRDCRVPAEFQEAVRDEG